MRQPLRRIIRGNVFVLKDERQPAVTLDTADCLGVEVTDNRLYGGNGEVYQGLPDLAADTGNQVFPLADAPRPEPSVPSIFEWQREQNR